jgi:hypothetical protein
MAIQPSYSSAPFSPSTTPVSFSGKTIFASPTNGPTGARYKAGQEGNDLWKVGAGCIEARAVDAGGGIANDPEHKICNKVQGITMPINPQFVSLLAFGEWQNMNWHCAGTSGSISTNIGLSVAV